MTELSARLALPLLQPGQAQKEAFHNEALIRIDALLHAAVASIATDAPPASPALGAAWIVGTAPSGAWAGKAAQIAVWTSGGWRFVAPRAGMTVWLDDAGRWAWHDGTAWRGGALPTGGVAVGGAQVVGAQQPPIADVVGGATIDSEGRAAIAAIVAALRAHGLIDT